jgi:hypothetical protein
VQGHVTVIVGWTSHDRYWRAFGLVSGLDVQVKKGRPRQDLNLRHLPPEPPVRRRLPPLPATTVSRTIPTVAHNHPDFSRVHVTRHVTAPDVPDIVRSSRLRGGPAEEVHQDPNL